MYILPQNPTIEIPLTKGFCTTIDECDSDLLMLKWRCQPNGRTFYASRVSTRIEGKRYNIAIHRIILSRILNRDLLIGEFVDHINGDGLDNRRDNLRLATKAQNAKNTRLYSNNSTGYKGVYYIRKGKWRALIMVNKEKIHLGYFNSPELAYEAYKQASINYHGEFGRFD